mmetsp:Transcript_18391/g.27750  ORF Transcript_18391/g.27750 Transcript_18391/m.27750 type:complete len:481 (+) Transcript_18391:70-1512(+)
MSGANMATEYEDMMESFAKLFSSGANPMITTNTWLPEKRAKYNAKRRQKDLDLVYSNWDLPLEMTETKINIADVPAKVAKKFKRAVAVHGNEWKRKDIEFCAKTREMESRGHPTAESMRFAFAHGTSTLEQMRKVLPTYQSRTIIDIPPDFRKFSSNIWEREISGNGSALNYLFWNNYRLAAYYNGPGERTNDDLCLRYVNEALSLLPALQRGEVPHYDEVLVRTVRALAKYCMNDFEAALMEYRVCLASIRLLHFEGRIDMSDATEKLMNRVNLWPHTILRMTIRVKIQNGVSRPYLTKDEYLDLMKENAYGIYSPSSQKCFHCGNTEKLLLCSGCSNAWYCSKSCAAKEWKKDHKNRCGSKKHTGTMTMPASSLEIVLREIENIDVGPEKVNSLGMSILNFGHRDFLVLCKDPSSGEIFDALTDETIEMQEGITNSMGFPQTSPLKLSLRSEGQIARTFLFLTGHFLLGIYCVEEHDT